MDYLTISAKRQCEWCEAFTQDLYFVLDHDDHDDHVHKVCDACRKKNNIVDGEENEVNDDNQTIQAL